MQDLNLFVLCFTIQIEIKQRGFKKLLRLFMLVLMENITTVMLLGDIFLIIQE